VKHWCVPLVVFVFACSTSPNRSRVGLDGLPGEAQPTEDFGSVSLDLGTLLDGFTSNPNLALQLEGDADYYCYKLDNAGWSAPTLITGPLVAELLSNGNHVLSVAACSADGLVDEQNITTVSFVVSAPAASLTVNTTPDDPGQVRVASTDAAVEQIKVSIDGGAFSAPIAIDPTRPADFFVGAAGSHSIEVITYAYGHWADEADAVRFDWSAREPMVALVPPPGPSASYVGEVTGDAQGYIYALDGGAPSAFQPLTTPLTLSALSDGPHMLVVTGVFASGITSGTPLTLTWTVDGTGPSTSAIAFTRASSGAPITPGSTIGGASFDIRVVDPDATAFTYVLTKDGTQVASGQGTSVSNVPLPGSGAYVATVSATDANGNTSAPIVLSFTLNQTEIVATLEPSLGPEDGQETTAASAQFVLVDEAPVATAERADWTLTIPGAPAVTGTTGFSGRAAVVQVALPASGAYTFTARALDSLGNEGTLQSRSFARDTLAPAEPLWALRDNANVAVTEGETVSDTRFPLRLSFERSGAQATSLISYALAGSSKLVVRELDSETLSEVTFGELLDDDYSVLVVARDRAGNYSTVAGPFTFSVDRTPPARAVFAVVPGGSERLQTSGSGFTSMATSVGANQIIYRSGRADGTLIETSTLPVGNNYVRPGPLAPGHWFVEASGVDANGNVQASATRYDWVSEVGLTNAWYVSASGDDSNPCTSSAAACATPQRAIDAASSYRLATPGNPEQLVKIRGGVYGVSGLVGRAGVLVLGGFDAAYDRVGEQTVLDASASAQGSTVTVASMGGAEVLLDGLELRPPVAPSGAVTFCVSGTNTVSASLLFNTCVLPASKEVTAFALQPSFTASHVVVRGNQVSGDATQARGIGVSLSLRGSSATISDNLFEQLQRAVEVAFLSDAATSTLIVSNNQTTLNSHSLTSSSDPEVARAATFLSLNVDAALALQPVASWRHASIDHNTISLGSHASLGISLAVQMVMPPQGGLDVTISDNDIGALASPLDQWIDYDQPLVSAAGIFLLSKTQANMAPADSVRAVRNRIHLGALSRRGPVGVTGLCAGFVSAAIPVVLRNDVRVSPFGQNCAGGNASGTIQLAAILGDDGALHNELSSNTVVWQDPADTTLMAAIIASSASVMFNQITLDDGVAAATRGLGVLLSQPTHGARIWANAIAARSGASAAYGVNAPGGIVDIRNNHITSLRQGIYSQNGEEAPALRIEDNTILMGDIAGMTPQSGINVYAGRDAKLQRNRVQWTGAPSNAQSVVAFATQLQQNFNISDNLLEGGSVGIYAWGVSGATTHILNNRASAAVGINAIPSAEADGSRGIVYIEHNTLLASFSGILVTVFPGEAALARVSNNIITGLPGSVKGLERHDTLDGAAFRAFNNNITGFSSAFFDMDTCSGCSVAALNASIYGYANQQASAVLDGTLVTQATTACSILTGGADTSQRVRDDAFFGSDLLQSAKRTLGPSLVSCVGSAGVSLGANEID
jgi:hypothetical protein